jgi:hypothetical protein
MVRLFYLPVLLWVTELDAARVFRPDRARVLACACFQEPLAKEGLELKDFLTKQVGGACWRVSDPVPCQIVGLGHSLAARLSWSELPPVVALLLCAPMLGFPGFHWCDGVRL